MNILDKYVCPHCHSDTRRRCVVGYDAYTRYECMCGGVSFHMGARLSGDRIVPPQSYTNWNDVVRVLAFTDSAETGERKGYA